MRRPVRRVPPGAAAPAQRTPGADQRATPWSQRASACLRFVLGVGRQNHVAQALLGILIGNRAQQRVTAAFAVHRVRPRRERHVAPTGRRPAFPHAEADQLEPGKGPVDKVQFGVSQLAGRAGLFICGDDLDRHERVLSCRRGTGLPPGRSMSHGRAGTRVRHVWPGGANAPPNGGPPLGLPYFKTSANCRTTPVHSRKSLYREGLAKSPGSRDSVTGEPGAGTPVNARCHAGARARFGEANLAAICPVRGLTAVGVTAVGNCQPSLHHRAVSLPAPMAPFAWFETPWGPALRCTALEPHASHVFTARGLDVPDAAARWLGAPVDLAGRRARPSLAHAAGPRGCRTHRHRLAMRRHVAGRGPARDRSGRRGARGPHRGLRPHPLRGCPDRRRGCRARRDGAARPPARRGAWCRCSGPDSAAARTT